MPAKLLGQQAPEQQEPTIHPENTENFEALKTLRDANMALVQQLSQYGMGLDPMSLLQTRLTALIETIFPSATPDGQGAQIQIELNFETMMASVLADLRRNAVSAQLAAGAQVPPDMLEQVAKAHGQPVPRGFRPGR